MHDALLAFDGLREQSAEVDTIIIVATPTNGIVAPIDAHVALKGYEFQADDSA